MILKKSTPEIENWFVDKLKQNGIKIYSFEGYSIQNEKVTALFERRESLTHPKEIKIEDVERELRLEMEEWRIKYKFSEILKVPFYFVIWKENIDEFLVLQILNENLKMKEIFLFKNCKSFSEWLSKLKGIQVKKEFVEGKRLSSIDICLRKCDVPWPGNLDGLLFNDSEELLAVFEFSRTRKTSVEKHDIRKYFKKDYNRWAVFEILRKSLNVPAYVVLWSTDEKIIKLQKIEKITDTLYYENEELISEDSLVSKFKML